MKAKHTPGPWKTYTTDQGLIDITAAGNDGTLTLAYMTGEDNIEINVEANAKLMAAAPDLLEALTSLYSKFKNDGIGSSSHYSPIMERAKAAIKKATE